jgi:uncharacterized protein DUF2017
MSHFAKTEDSDLHVALEEREAAVLRDVLAEMSLLLGENVSASDPVIVRLFPKAYENEAEQQSYEGLVADELRRAKSTALKAVREKLGAEGSVDVVVGASEIDAWLTVLTDLRLAIGMRLNVTEETMDSDIDPADPDAEALSVLHWLGWIQHSIIEEITGE